MPAACFDNAVPNIEKGGENLSEVITKGGCPLPHRRRVPLYFSVVDCIITEMCILGSAPY